MTQSTSQFRVMHIVTSDGRQADRKGLELGPDDPAVMIDELAGCERRLGVFRGVMAR